MTRSLLIACALLALFATPAIGAMEAPPMTLPGDAHAASGPADPDTWIVGAHDAGATAPLAHRYGATAVGSVGAYVVARRDARAFAAALRRRGLLSFAELREVVGFDAYDAVARRYRGESEAPSSLRPTPIPSPVSLSEET